MHPATYLLASRPHGALYAGVTSNLPLRIWQHRNDILPGFTRRYGIHTLVWYELHPTMESAIGMEKAIKAWKRSWKIELIEAGNPAWKDRFAEIV